MCIAITVTGRHNDYGVKSMDFWISIDGVSDNTEYRMTEGEKTFKKLFSCYGTAHGYSIRGNKRKTAEELVKAIFNTNLKHAISIQN